MAEPLGGQDEQLNEHSPDLHEAADAQEEDLPFLERWWIYYITPPVRNGPARPARGVACDLLEQQLPRGD